MSNPLHLVEPLLLGELDDDSIRALERWLESDPAHRVAFLREVQLCRGIRRALLTADEGEVLNGPWNDADESAGDEIDVLSEVIDQALADRRRHEIEDQAQALLDAERAASRPMRIQRASQPGWFGSPTLQRWAGITGLAAVLFFGLLLLTWLTGTGDSPTEPGGLADTVPSNPDSSRPPAAGFVAAVQDAYHARWGSRGQERPNSLGDLRPGVYHLASGAVRLEMAGGTGLLIEGPAVFELVDGNTGLLVSGRLTAYTGRSSRGFHVSTPSARLENGTGVFAVWAQDNGATQAHVFQGSVDFAAANQPTSAAHHLRADRGAVIANPNAPVVAQAFSSTAFATEMASLSGKPVTSGEVDYLRTLPDSVVMNRGPQSPRAWIALESTGQPLRRGTISAQGYPERPRVFNDPRGQVVDSYLVVFDPDDETNRFKSVEFTLTFPGEVVTVITEDADLAECHGWYGHDRVRYSYGPLQVDGLEGTPGNINAESFVPDTIDLSDDGRTMRVFLGVHNGADVFRVLVARPARVGMAGPLPDGMTHLLPACYRPGCVAEASDASLPMPVWVNCARGSIAALSS